VLLGIGPELLVVGADEDRVGIAAVEGLDRRGVPGAMAA
jgi:hypothetical protein